MKYPKSVSSEIENLYKSLTDSTLELLNLSERHLILYFSN